MLIVTRIRRPTVTQICWYAKWKPVVTTKNKEATVHSSDAQFRAIRQLINPDDHSNSLPFLNPTLMTDNVWLWTESVDHSWITFLLAEFKQHPKSF